MTNLTLRSQPRDLLSKNCLAVVLEYTFYVIKVIWAPGGLDIWKKHSIIKIILPVDNFHILQQLNKIRF